MGYAEFSLENFSGAFLPLGASKAATKGRRRGYGDAQKCSSSKLTLDSDFLQSIVAPAISLKPCIQRTSA
jgi:hypothetical protein